MMRKIGVGRYPQVSIARTQQMEDHDEVDLGLCLPPAATRGADLSPFLAMHHGSNTSNTSQVLYSVQCRSNDNNNTGTVLSH